MLANESKGLTQSQPKIEEKEPDAIEIQGKNTKIKPKKKAGDGFQGEAAAGAGRRERIRLRSEKADRSAVLTERSARPGPRADSELPAAAEISGRSTPGTCT